MQFVGLLTEARIAPIDGTGDPSARLGDPEYARLYQFRARLLRFQRASDARIQRAGLTPSQYLLLLAVRASESESELGPTIGEVAEFLILKHHSVVELVDRASAGGLIRRCADPDDGRMVRLRLTVAGRDRLERIARENFRELGRLRLLDQGLEQAAEESSGGLAESV
jgi:DNA-binding MarR family transcriptional regulator